MRYVAPMTKTEAREIAGSYGYGNSHPGSRALRDFARTGIIGDNLRGYLTDSRANPAMMPPRLRQLAEYVRNN
jgi:hypothetical protein